MFFILSDSFLPQDFSSVSSFLQSAEYLIRKALQEGTGMCQLKLVILPSLGAPKLASLDTL